jgi:nucleoid-associated protein YgaU
MWKSLKKQFDSPDSYVSLALGLAVVLVIGMITYNYFRSRTGLGGSSDQAKEGQQIALPAKHTVKEGDTLWSVAENYYKSGYNWVDIQKANNLESGDAIEVGQVLTIPDAAPLTVPGEISSASVVKPEKKTYTVVAGDTLWDIAMKNYGSGYKWTDIANANNLVNPDLIYPGNVLTLP